MSFEIARSGINAVNGSLDAISNNIANAGTYGFKSSRANFSAMYAGNHANGAEMSSLSQSIAQTGGLLNTGGSMDAMIEGKGFFALRDASGQTTYSRVGLFKADKEGYLVDAEGRKVQGYGAVTDSNGDPVADAGLGELGDIHIPNGQIGAQASNKLGFQGNLSSDWTVPSKTTFDKDDPSSFNSSTTSVVYDSKGGKHALTQYFVKTGSNAVDVHYSFDGAKPSDSADTTLTFDAEGKLATVGGSTEHTASFKVTPDGAEAMALSVDYTSTTQYAGDTTTLVNAANGHAAGTLTGTSLGADGSITATYSNGQQQKVGTVALATFANENGLKPINDTSWTASIESGTPLYGQPGTGSASALSVGGIEQSNVDMTGELVNLMSAQRNYQANTKVITAENEMMQSLLQAV
jgi:flagellar hook protein FlgE